jgi:mannose-6-phosphate isomerase-like protein (cupin superfamily)
MAGLRVLRFGVDDAGGSCLVEDSEVVGAPIPAVPGVAMAAFWSTDQSPPPPCPPGLGTLAAGPEPGFVEWHLVDYDPPASPDEETPGTELHHRNAIDLVVILTGSGEFLLADGTHAVGAGDCIVMPGTDHGFRPGAEGCRMLGFEIGTPPAS